MLRRLLFRLSRARRRAAILRTAEYRRDVYGGRVVVRLVDWGLSYEIGRSR
jgi:hypothetical protein